MKEKFQWGILLIGILIGIAISFFFCLMSIDKTSPTMINCNCPELTCPENNQEDTINNCIKILNDAETIKDLVEKGGKK